MKTGALRRVLSLAVLVVLAVVLAGLVWSRWGSLAAPEAALEGRYRTEEQWIAAEIAQDILEMAQYAKDPRSSSEVGRFAVEPLARNALDASGEVRSAVAPSNDETTLAALTSPLADVIEAQNQRVSQHLTASMADADADEEAALVVGALVVREASEVFWDVRQLLCRMAAHLSMARALRHTPEHGLNGRYADAILAAYASRSREAMKKLDALEASAGGSQGQRAWVRALRIWLTADWRPLASPSQGTLIERLLYFRALGWTLGGASAVQFYQSFEAEPIPDWGRIALENLSGTEVGGFAEEGAEPEQAEARDIWRRIHGRDLAGSDLVAALNRPASRCITPTGPRVLAWGTWAAGLQRHVCHRVLRINRYWEQVVALPEQAQATRAAFDDRFGGLVLYPFVQGLRWHHGRIHLESFGSALNRGVSTAAEHPELLTAFVWDRMAQTARYAVTRRRMPPLLPWFAAWVPSGTAYAAGSRVYLPGFEQAATEPLTALWERNPWNYSLNSRIVEARFGQQPTPDQIHGVFAQRANYDVGVLRWMAGAAGGRSPERARLLEDACKLLADSCVDLARHLVAARHDEEAVPALQRAFERAKDRVALTHGILALVAHYHDRGQHAEASRVAQEAADTGSSAGLALMGRLKEWRGELEGAEDYFQQVESRYKEPEELAAFYRRMVDAGRSGYQSKFQHAISAAFPNGLERLDPKQLPPIPTDGVGLSNPGPDAPLAGLEAGDIVVGLDGLRVHDRRQYMYVVNFDSRPDMTMHLWRKGRYLEVPVHVMNRYLPLDLHTYPTTER